MKRLLPGALALALMVPAAAGAHHSFAMFDFQKKIAIEGVVREFQWTNPHSTLWVVVKDKAGATQDWAIEMTSPGNLRRLGMSKDAFSTGDRVKVDIHPLRNGSNGGSFEGATLLATGKRVAYPDDYRSALGKPDL